MDEFSVPKMMIFYEKISNVDVFYDLIQVDQT